MNYVILYRIFADSELQNNTTCPLLEILSDKNVMKYRDMTILSS